MEQEGARAIEARHALVSGRVQGVAFRYYAVRKAEELGLAGWVRNLPDADGRVEVHAEGWREPLEEFLRWLHEGPPAARVLGVQVREVAPEGRLGFDVR